MCTVKTSYDKRKNIIYRKIIKDHNVYESNMVYCHNNQIFIDDNQCYVLKIFDKNNNILYYIHYNKQEDKIYFNKNKTKLKILSSKLEEHIFNMLSYIKESRGIWFSDNFLNKFNSLAIHFINVPDENNDNIERCLLDE